MGKRRKRKAVAVEHVPVATAEHTFHVLAYAKRDGVELAVCLDCDHTEPWNKGAAA